MEAESFKIPIEEFEEDIDLELPREKKKDILDLFTNSNKICSKDEFKKISYKLHAACRDCNLELIKILLGKTIKNESLDLSFKIDETSQTASLFNSNENVSELNIPRTVQHENTEYLITSISGINANTKRNIERINFTEDSAIKTIYNYAFSNSNIEEILIPSKVSKICEGAFSCCLYLAKVEIPPNSNLQTIESNVFYNTYIKELYFPSSLKELKEGWCNFTNNLTKNYNFTIEWSIHIYRR